MEKQKRLTTKFDIKCVLCPCKWTMVTKADIVGAKEYIEFICRDCFTKYKFEFYEPEK